MSTTAMTKTARNNARLIAVAMMIIGVLAMLLPFYIGIATAMIIGVAIASVGALGLLVSYRLKQAGYQTQSGFLYGFYLLVGVLLTLMPQLTLGIAAFLLGASLLLIGLFSWRSAGHSTFAKVKAVAALLLGVLVILSGASGIAWLIGVCFGISLLLQGINLWASVSQRPLIIEMRD